MRPLWDNKYSLICRERRGKTRWSSAAMGGAYLLMMLLAGMHEAGAAEQHGTERDNKASNAIFVTATRSEKKITEVAASTGKKSHDEIVLDDPVFQKDIFNSIAGVRVTQTGSTVGHMTSIRMPTNTDPVYLFLQDGIPVQSSGFFNHNGLAYTNYTTAGSVEVLKGAGTALYGSDAVAATINVQSIPIGRQHGFSVRPEYGSEDFFRIGAGGGIALGDSADLSLNLSYLQAPGWRKHTRSRRNELTVQHVIDFNDSNTLKTIVSYNHTDAEMAGNLIGLNELYNNRRSAGDVLSKLDKVDARRKFDFFRASAEWINNSLKNTELSSIVYVRRNRNRYAATWLPSLPKNDSEQRSGGALLKVDAHVGAVHAIAGLDFEVTNADELFLQAFDFVPTRFGAPVAAGAIYDYTVDYTALAPYARIEYQLTDSLRIAGGVRYDRDSFNYTNNTTVGQYAASDFFRPADNNDPTFNHVSPKADILYALTAHQSMYFRYANGFRIPQASRLYRLKTNNIGFTLQPEKSDTFEVGYKLGTERHQAELSLYFLQIRDTIVRRENARKERFFVNAGKTKHYGVEASLSSRVLDDVTLKLAYSYSHHKFDNDPQFGNNTQAEAPRDLANVRLIYAPSWVAGLRAMFEWEHVGSWYLDNENSKKYGGYNVGNIKLDYHLNKHLSMFAKVTNLTDKVYAETARIGFGREKYMPASPRAFFAGMEMRM